jgi:hypothetical protein
MRCDLLILYLLLAGTDGYDVFAESSSQTKSTTTGFFFFFKSNVSAHARSVAPAIRIRLS